jgi:hypothetical protein
MTTQCVWTCGVDWDRAMELLRSGCGKRVVRWDDRTWRFWRELGWDWRPPSELDTQPTEVQAYALNPFEMSLLGAWADKPTPGVLFVLHDTRWAAVAADTYIEVNKA